MFYSQNSRPIPEAYYSETSLRFPSWSKLPGGILFGRDFLLEKISIWGFPFAEDLSDGFHSQKASLRPTIRWPLWGFLFGVNFPEGFYSEETFMRSSGEDLPLRFSIPRRPLWGLPFAEGFSEVFYLQKASPRSSIRISLPCGILFGEGPPRVFFAEKLFLGFGDDEGFPLWEDLYWKKTS